MAEKQLRFLLLLSFLTLGCQGNLIRTIEVGEGVNVTLRCENRSSSKYLAIGYFRILGNGREVRLAQKFESGTVSLDNRCHGRCAMDRNVSLVIMNVNQTDSGRYKCREDTYEKGKYEEEILVRVVGRPAKPSLTLNSSEVLEGDAVQLTCDSPGKLHHSVTYEWRREGDVIGASNKNKHVIKDVGPSEGGSYTCIVKTVGGQAASDPVPLTVKADLVPPESINTTYVSSSAVTLTWRSRYSGIFTKSFTFILSHQTERKEYFGQLIRQTDGNYVTTIYNLKPHTCYNVSVKVSAGGVHRTADFTVICTEPKLELELVSSVNPVQEKASTDLVCRAQSDSGDIQKVFSGQLSFSWMKAGKAVNADNVSRRDRFTSVYKIKMATPKDMASYQCHTRTELGFIIDSQPVLLNVSALPFHVSILRRQSERHERSVVLKWVTDYAGSFIPEYTVTFESSKGNRTHYKRLHASREQIYIANGLSPSLCYDVTVTAVVNGKHETSKPQKFCWKENDDTDRENVRLTSPGNDDEDEWNERITHQDRETTEQAVGEGEVAASRQRAPSVDRTYIVLGSIAAVAVILLQVVVLAWCIKRGPVQKWYVGQAYKDLIETRSQVSRTLSGSSATQFPVQNEVQNAIYESLDDMPHRDQPVVRVVPGSQLTVFAKANTIPEQERAHDYDNALPVLDFPNELSRMARRSTPNMYVEMDQANNDVYQDMTLKRSTVATPQTDLYANPSVL